MRDYFAMASFIMAVIGGLASMFNKHRDKQTMGSIIGIVLLLEIFLTGEQ